MTTYFERDYANGKTVVRVDSRHLEVVFIEDTGAVHQFRCEGTNARLDELLNASEGDEFDPRCLDGWESGAEHIRVRFEE